MPSYHSFVCHVSEQNYKNIDIICNNRWLDLIMNIFSFPHLVIYFVLALPIVFIELVLSIITRGKITIDIVFIVIVVVIKHLMKLDTVCQRIFGNELIAIRVFRRRNCLSLLYYHILYPLFWIKLKLDPV